MDTYLTITSHTGYLGWILWGFGICADHVVAADGGCEVEAGAAGGNCGVGVEVGESQGEERVSAGRRGMKMRQRSKVRVEASMVALNIWCQSRQKQ